jgi:hypothetical protein
MVQRNRHCAGLTIPRQPKDFNMLQSGHQMDSAAYGLAENHALIAHDYGLMPVKPVLDGEPIYEDTPDAIWITRDLAKPRADAAAVRRKAYWSVFAGACGHTYGNNNVFGFFVPPSAGFVTRRPMGSGSRELWKTALDAPGGAQLSGIVIASNGRGGPWPP